MTRARDDMDAPGASPTSRMIRELAAEVLRTPEGAARAKASDAGRRGRAREDGEGDALTDGGAATGRETEDASMATSAFERRLEMLEREAERVGVSLERDEAETRSAAARATSDAEREALAAAAARRAAAAVEARDVSLRDALKTKERAIESLSASLASTRESYERRLRVEAEASAANAAREEALRGDMRALSERVRSLETKAEVREHRIASQHETIGKLTRDLEAKRAFDVEVADQTRTLEIDRLEQRLSASEARADAAERKLETYFLEKVSLEREIADLRERLARVPSQEAQDEAFRLRVERAAEARIATERLVNEEMQTKAELAGLFAQIREMTLRSAGVTSAPPPTATSAADELARVKRAAEAEIESRKREFASLQADIGRENATLRRELASVRAKLNAKLGVGAATNAESESSPWAAEFSFASPASFAAVESSPSRKPSRASPSESTESFIEIIPSARDV